MDKTTLGRTGIEVTRLGLGLAEISRQEQRGGETADASHVLNLALDIGINFLDTAACYASTEALIGSAVSHRRDEFFLASKCGHAVDTDAEPWTAELIAESVDRSLRRLDTDYLDILQLHSCDLDVLKRGEVIEALVSRSRTGQDPVHWVQRRQRSGPVGCRERYIRHASDQLQPGGPERPPGSCSAPHARRGWA